MTILTFTKKQEKEIKVKFQYRADYHDGTFIYGSKEITKKQLMDIQRVLRNELYTLD